MFVHILGVPKPCCQLEILLEGVEKWVMHKICCLFSLVRLLLKLKKSPEYCLNTGKYWVEDSLWRNRWPSSDFLCLGATCLTALFGIQQQPSSLASSLSMGPQHLFPLLCRNFLYLARSWTLSIGVQFNVSNSLREIRSVLSDVVIYFFAVAQLLKRQY